jgi:hypothetical protein
MLQRVDVRDKRGLRATGPIAIQAALITEDRFGMAMADDEGLAAAPTGFRTTVREIWRDLLHVTGSYE